MMLSKGYHWESHPREKRKHPTKSSVSFYDPVGCGMLAGSHAARDAKVKTSVGRVVQLYRFRIRIKKRHPINRMPFFMTRRGIEPLRASLREELLKFPYREAVGTCGMVCYASAE